MAAALKVLSATIPHLSPCAGAEIMERLGNKLAFDFEPSASGRAQSPAQAISAISRKTKGDEIPGSAAVPAAVPRGIDLDDFEKEIGTETADEIVNEVLESACITLDVIRRQKIKHVAWSFGAAIFALIGGTTVLLVGAVISYWAELTTGGALTAASGAFVSFCSRSAFTFYKQCSDRLRETEKDLQLLTTAKSKLKKGVALPVVK
jgi:hypothetical protein